MPLSKSSHVKVMPLFMPSFGGVKENLKVPPSGQESSLLKSKSLAHTTAFPSSSSTQTISSKQTGVGALPSKTVIVLIHSSITLFCLIISSVHCAYSGIPSIA